MTKQIISILIHRVNFVMSEDTTLADLLDLNLHNFEDEVHNIVDKAIKEMAMERMLKELEVIWSAMDFQHEIVSQICKKARQFCSWHEIECLRQTVQLFKAT